MALSALPNTQHPMQQMLERSETGSKGSADLRTLLSLQYTAVAALRPMLRVDAPVGLILTTHSNCSLSSSETVSGSDVRTRWTYRSLWRQ